MGEAPAEAAAPASNEAAPAEAAAPAAPAAEPAEDELDKKLKPAFADIDKDNSGFIEAGELKNVLKTMGLDMSDEEIEGVLKMADKNADHKLDYAEYKQLVSKSMK